MMILRTVFPFVAILLTFFLALHAVIVALDGRASIKHRIEIVDMAKLMLFDTFITVAEALVTILAWKARTSTAFRGIAVALFAGGMVAVTTSFIVVIVSETINGFLEFLELFIIDTVRIITLIHME